MNRPELLNMEKAAEFTYCESVEAFRVMAKKHNTPFTKIGKRHWYDKKDLLELMDKMKQYPLLDRVETSSGKETICRSISEVNTIGRSSVRQMVSGSISQPKLKIVDRLKSLKTN